MSLGGGGGGASVVSTHGLPEYSGMPTKIENYLTKADTLSNSIFSKYTAATYPADQDSSVSTKFTSVLETQGITKIATRASSGDPALSIGRTLIDADLTGAKLNDDIVVGTSTAKADYYAELVAELVENTSDNDKASIDQAANLLGRFGGSGHQIVLYKMGDVASKNLMELGKSVFYNDYKRERQDQEEAMTLAHTYANESLKDMEHLRLAGTYVREYEQGKLTDAYKLYQHNNDFQIKRLTILGNALKNLMGAETQTSTPFHIPSAFSQVAGLALTIAPVYAGAVREAKTITPNSGKAIDAEIRAKHQNVTGLSGFSIDTKRPTNSILGLSGTNP